LTKALKTYVKEIHSSTNSVGKTGYPHVEDCNWLPVFLLVENINSK
jgi:hypothetical protein